MSAERRVRRLVGVYDADGTVLGEVSYFVKARLGRAHCALCDITHGLVRERDEWRSARRALPVEFVTYHRDDQPDEVRAVTAGLLPSVVAELDGGGVVLVLDADQLAACGGEPGVLIERVRSAAADAGLDLGA